MNANIALKPQTTECALTLPALLVSISAFPHDMIT